MHCRCGLVVPHQHNEAHRHRDTASLASMRIVRRAIRAIGNSVMIVVSFPPAPTLKFPAIFVLDPYWLSVVVTLAQMLPMPGAPHMMMASNIPVTGQPDITHARLRYRLNANWGRGNFYIRYPRRGLPSPGQKNLRQVMPHTTQLIGKETGSIDSKRSCRGVNGRLSQLADCQ